MHDFAVLREHMVDEQIVDRGVQDQLVLNAMRKVRRENFVPKALQAHAYADTPLPIDGDQTIMQPYVVAFMIEALALEGGEKVLEVGAGAGYAAAVLAEIADSVYTIERLEHLATKAAECLAHERYYNVHVRHADGLLGWVDNAPFDAILVSFAVAEIPEELSHQLAIGGRMVIPLGADPRAQELVRITRTGQHAFHREDLADVRFVPPIGEEGWEPDEFQIERSAPRIVRATADIDTPLSALIGTKATAFDDVGSVALDNIIDRIGDARVVLIGEATHGTSEFYRLRARITQALIERLGFAAVAVEADWPDAAKIDHYVRHRDAPASGWTAFSRFPQWMWRNQETQAFVEWLHDYNKGLPEATRTAFYGLDLYSLYVSVRAVVEYLEDVDPALAEIARQRYGCLTPWQADPSAYGHAALTGAYHACEEDVSRMLIDLLRKRDDYSRRDRERYLDALQNAKLIENAEAYYRVMYYGSRASWNLRDSHMFDTLQAVRSFHGMQSRVVVWAHNSHVGDAAATEMAARGEHNLGQLCRAALHGKTYHIGFGTDHGTVAAATNWDGEMEIKHVRPAHPQSYESLFHHTEAPGLLVPLRLTDDGTFHRAMAKPRLQRAIGVIYRPERELASHYFETRLAHQFDEYIWIDETKAITPITSENIAGMPDTYPFGL